MSGWHTSDTITRVFSGVRGVKSAPGFAVCGCAGRGLTIVDGRFTVSLAGMTARTYALCVRYLDLSGEPSIQPLLNMLKSMTGGTSSRDVLSEFMGQYGRVRPISAFAGLKPVPDDPGAYRVMYAVRAIDSVNGRVPHTRDDTPEALARLPVRRGVFLGRLIADMQPKLVFGWDDIDDEQVRAVAEGTTSCMALPILRGDTVAEWTFAFSRAPEGAIQPRDVSQALMVANLLGASNRHADSLQEVRRLNSALREQFDSIARVQQSLLPARPPEIPELEIATSYLTSDEAGGDYYDFFALPGGRWGVLIADVSGHGAGAATVMAMLHAILHCYDHEAAGPDPAAVMRFANRRLVAANLEGMFVTAFFAVHDPVTGEFTYCNCGHNPPRLKRGLDGSVAAVDGGCAGVPLGILAEAEYVSESMLLGPMDTVILYTDGITEAFSPEMEMFGTARLDAALLDCTGRPDCVVETVHKALYSHRKSATRDDDQTIVALRRHAHGSKAELLGGV